MGLPPDPPVIHFQLRTSLEKTHFRFRAGSISLRYVYPTEGYRFPSVIFCTLPTFLPHFSHIPPPFLSIRLTSGFIQDLSDSLPDSTLYPWLITLSVILLHITTITLTLLTLESLTRTLVRLK